MSPADPLDRFGVELAGMTAEVAAHNALGINRIGCYVPTRAEVATMPATDLEAVLDFWM